MKKKILILVTICFISVCFIAVCMIIGKIITTRSTTIIAIPGGQEYGSGMYEEYFVIVNPPNDIVELRNLIIEYNNSNPIVPPPPPDDTEDMEISVYRRRFYKESKGFPRNISFYSLPIPRDDLMWEYGHRDWLAYVRGDINETNYRIRTVKYDFCLLGFHFSDYNYLDYEEHNRDLTLNELLNHIPEHIISPRIRELLEEG